MRMSRLSVKVLVSTLLMHRYTTSQLILAALRFALHSPNDYVTSKHKEERTRSGQGKAEQVASRGDRYVLLVAHGVTHRRCMNALTGVEVP